MSIEAMKQALEAMEKHGTFYLRHEHDYKKAITALRQAIAEAEKIVPSDYPNSHQQERHISYVCPNCHWSLDKQVRTHTPEDIKKIESNWVGLETDHKSAPPRQRSFYDDVGRLIKAGKGFYDDGTPIDYKDIQLKIEGTGEDTFECVEVRIPRPPQRAWVGLTDHELQVLDFNDPERGKLARAVEAKLKERNSGN
jgi:ribosomal protein S18